MTRLTATSAFISSSPALPAARSTPPPGGHDCARGRREGKTLIRLLPTVRRRFPATGWRPAPLAPRKSPDSQAPKPQQKIVNNSCFVKDFRTLAQPLLAVCYEARDSFWG